MAKVERFKEKPGEMFGGKGADVFRPFERAPSATNGSTPQEPISSEAEQALQKLFSETPQHNAENSKKTP